MPQKKMLCSRSLKMEVEKQNGTWKREKLKTTLSRTSWFGVLLPSDFWSRHHVIYRKMASVYGDALHTQCFWTRLFSGEVWKEPSVDGRQGYGRKPCCTGCLGTTGDCMRHLGLVDTILWVLILASLMLSQALDPARIATQIDTS